MSDVSRHLAQMDSKTIDAIDKVTDTPVPGQFVEDASAGADDMQPWAVVLDAAKKFDEKLIGNWKEDMQNMLIFAGLFSTVVTSFVIASYNWLQPDSSDTSAQWLAQISSQLSSLSLNGGFINSTSPAAPEPFVPSLVAVRVNTLWFLSLAMSLIAALTAIVAQQWMRAYQDLGYLSLREAVRLRELRYRALHLWRVPEIVNAVPILLQVALVLFLTGTWILLQPLNETVFTPYATFVAISFFFFASSIVMSVISPTCAYKSPISYALGVTVKTGVISAYCAMMAVMYVAMGIAQVFVMVYRGWLQSELDAWMLHVDVKLSLFMSKISKAASKIPLDYTSTAVEYWLARERSLLDTPKDLDSTALSWVLPWLSEDKFTQLTHCLRGLESSEEKLKVAVAWVGQKLNIHLYTKYAITDYSGPFTNERASKIDQHFAKRYCDILLDVLPDTWSTESATVSADEHRFKMSVLVVLRQTFRACSSLELSFKKRYTEKVLRLRKSQAHVKASSTTESRFPELRLPTESLFECSTMLKHEFNDEELATLLMWAKEVHEDNLPISPRLGAPRVWINSLELLLASSATASDAISRRAKAVKDESIMPGYLDLLDSLCELISSESTRILVLALNAEEWFGRGVPPVIVDALRAIAQSVVDLAQAEYIWHSEDCPSRALIGHLCRLFDGQALFSDVLPQLQELNSRGHVMRPPPSDKSTADVAKGPSSNAPQGQDRFNEPMLGYRDSAASGVTKTKRAASPSENSLNSVDDDED